MLKYTLTLLKLAVAETLLAFAVDAYVPVKPASLIPTVVDFAAAQKGNVVEIRLDIGEERDGPRLLLNKLNVEFLGDEMGDERTPPLLGGAKGGPFVSRSSSPLYRIRKISNPSHRDLTGLNTVEVSNGCWRLFSENGSPSGSVVYGFNFPEETKYRNGASLSSCDMYITFNIWGGKHLSKLREKKISNRRSASQYMQESESLVEKGRSATGVLEWASNYRKAMLAAEKSWKASQARKRSFDYIPEERDTLRVGDDTYLSKKGTVWTGSMHRGKLQYKTLGAAFAAKLDAK